MTAEKAASAALGFVGTNKWYRYQNPVEIELCRDEHLWFERIAPRIFHNEVDLHILAIKFVHCSPTQTG